MCMCAKPNVNGEFGYSWDGKGESTRPPNPPELADGDFLLYDEPGRCGGMDSHSHHFCLVQRGGRTELLVRHGAGDERIYVSLPRGFTFDAMDSNTRYWVFHALHYAYRDGRKRGTEATTQEYRRAFADGRLKKRKMPGQDAVKIWIEPQTTTGAR